MKRYAALLAALAVLFVPEIVQAAGMKIVAPLPWRDNKNVTSSNFNASLGYSYPDSSVARWGAFTATAYTTAGVPDTTAPFSLDQVEFTNAGSDTDVDTLYYMTFSLHPKIGSSFTAGADTFWCTTQLSQDGVNWVSVTGHTGEFALETSSNNAFYINYGLNELTVRQWNYAVTSGTAPIRNEMVGPWRFIRWFVYGDMTGEYEASASWVEP